MQNSPHAQKFGLLGGDIIVRPFWPSAGLCTHWSRISKGRSCGPPEGALWEALGPGRWLLPDPGVSKWRRGERVVRRTKPVACCT